MNSEQQILLHTETRSYIAQVLTADTHAILLTGNEGAGKGFLASYLASQWLSTNTAKISSHQSVYLVQGKEDGIGIDEVREIQKFLRLKTVGADKVRRVVIIEDAEYMTPEAQNAFLKTLEEPPEDTRIVMTCSDSRSLRPTIVSRLQRIQVKPTLYEETKGYFEDKGTDTAQFDEAYRMSQGGAGLLHAVLDASDNHELVIQIKHSKQLLVASPYERLLEIDPLTKDKKKIPLLLLSLKLIAQAGLIQSTQTNRQIIRWKNILGQVLECEQAFRSNANTKLLLTDLFLHM